MPSFQKNCNIVFVIGILIFRHVNRILDQDVLIVIETHQLLKVSPVIISKRYQEKKNEPLFFLTFEIVLKHKYKIIVMPSNYHSHTNTLLYYLNEKYCQLEIYYKNNKSIHDVTCSQMQYFNEY